MSDPREALAQFLARSRRGVTAKVNDNDRQQADALFAEFLIVPRKEIQGVEYGFRSSPEDIAFLTDSRENAIEGAAEKREWQRNAMNQIEAEAVQRPSLPWTPIPEGGDGNG